MSRATNARRSRILVTSFSASLGAVIVLAVAFFFCGTSAEAANNCTLTSTAPTTNWSDQTKWGSCGGTYPNNGDTANIGLSGFTMNVDVPVNVNLQMTNGAAIAVNNTLQLESSSTATSSGTIAINSGGKLSVAPSVTITGVQSALTVNSGGIFEIQSGGQFNIGPGASFVFAGGTIQGPGTLTVPLFTPVAFTGGSGPMTMTGALIFNNNGTVNLVSSTNALAINSGTQFNNQSGATFSVQTSVPVTTDSVSAPAINNAGSLNCTSGVNPTINPPVNNTGSITLQTTSTTQTLTLAGGGTHTGSFSTSSPTIGTIKFAGPHNFNSGWSWGSSPSSIFELVSGTSTVSASFVTPFFTQDGGTLAGNGNVTMSSGFDWKGGTQTGGGLTILSGAIGTIDGTSTATLDGRTLQVNSGGSLTYNPGAGGSLALINSAAIAANAQFDLKSDTTITSDGSTVINVGSGGSITKSAGTRTLLNPFVTLSSGASIQPSANTIALGGGATISGLLNTSTAGSFVELAGNTATLAAGATVSSGDLKLTGGTLAANTNLAISTLAQSAGTLKGTSTLTVNNTFNWTGGTMDGDTGGTGILAIASPNGIANINGTGPTTLQHRFTFQNGGTLHYQPTNPLAVNTGGQITNTGSWNLENSSAITSDLVTYFVAPLFTNSNLLTKTVGGTTSFGVPINNTATISFNNGSDIELTGGGTINGGSITFNNAADVLGIQTNNVTVTNTPATTGPGFLRVGNLGTLTQSTPTMIVPNFELDTNGTLSNANAFTIGTKLIWTGGLMTGGGSTALSLGATGDMTVMSGSPALSTYTFQNNGTITLGNAFPLQFNGSAIFNNTATGILDVTGPGGTSSSGGANSFTNAGTFKRSTAGGIYSVDLPFTNTGTVDAAFANAFFDFQGGGSMTTGNMSGSVATAGIEFSAGTFNVSGGNFNGVGGVKINGGTLNVSGPVTGPTSMALLSGTLGTTSGTISFNSPAVFTQTGGTIKNVQLIANSGAQIKFDSTSSLLNVDGATIGYNASSTGQWIGGNSLFMKNGASMSIGGTVTFSGFGTIPTAGTTPTITVNGGGTLQKTTLASSIGIAANLQNNGGTISSINGALQLNYTGSSSQTGTFSTTSPGTIDFGGGTHTFTSVTGSGTGFLNFTSGTITLANSTSLANLYLGTATINGAGPFTFTGTFNWDGGALNAPATNSGGTLNLLGGSSQMDLGANLTSGANFSSPTNAFAIGTGVTYTNNGTFTISADGPINGLGTFVNSGTLTKSGGTASTVFCTFNNNGTASVSTGSLAFNGGGNDSGTYSSTSGTSLGFSGGVRTLSNTAVIGAGAAGTTAFSNTFTDNGTFTPAGPVTISGGTVTLNTVGTATINGLSFTVGTLTGSSPLQLLGTANQWKGGTITGSGSFTVPSGAALTLASGFGPILSGRTLTNAGSIIGGAALESISLDNGAILNNQASGTFDFQNSFSITNNTGTGAVSNAGLFKKSCCVSQTSAITVPFTNTGNVDSQIGTIDFSSFTQSAGTTKLTGGNLSSAATMNFSGGTLAGAGSINAPLTNSGATIDPGDPVTPGALTINGTFNQTAGTLVTDLFANNSNDQLLVPGNNANVAGNLNVQLVSPYSPASGDSFTVINAGALTDTTTKSYPSFGPNNTGFFTPTTTATTLSLAAVIPQADVSVAGTTAPASVVHTNTWTVTIPVANNGPNGATGVTVTVTPTNGTLSSLASTQGSCVGNSCNLGSLANLGSATVTANIVATTMPNVSATVTVAANETDPTPANNTSNVSATVTPSADLSLAITDSPDPVNAGATVNYTATITNNGPDSSASVTTFTISGGGTFGALPVGCSGSTPTITCTSGTIANPGSTNFVIPVTAPGAGPVSLTGNVSASGATDSNGANNGAVQSTTVTPSADLSITKSGPASVAAGNNISYTIVVTNNGPSDANNVQVTDPTPAGLTFVSNSGACSTPFPCSLATLTSGSSATIIATYSTPAVGAPSSVTNTASVASSTTPDPNNTNNSASATTSIGPSADVAVTVTAPSAAMPGSNFNVVVKIQNNGPSAATGISVASTVPSTFTFVANGGACTTAYPCSIGTLNPGQFVQITSTYQVVTGGTSGTINYTATATSPDPNSADNSANATITTGCPSSAPTQLSPAQGSTVPAYTFLHWNNVGADEYNVYLGPAGSGCTQFFGKRSTHFGVNTDILVSLDPGTTYEWAVEAVTPNCPTRKSACVTFTTQSNCGAAAPQPVSPTGGIVPSPVTFTWTPSTGATLYTVKNAADDSVFGTSTTTSLPNIVVPDGPVTWYVVADVPQCGQLRSNNAAFNGCSIPNAPVVGAVAQAATGQTYAVQWDRLADALNYELQEASNESFTGATTTVIGQPATGNISVPFTKSTNSGALVFFYRVRAQSLCGQTFGPYSTPIRVVVLPPPPKTQKNPSVNVPVGSNQIVVQQVFVPGLADGVVHTFIATVDQPWLTVDPSSGILPADGITLNVNANPANLPNGTITGTVIVTISSASGKTGSNGATVVSTPVSVNLVTPVIPSSKDLPPDNTLIIPSVGHLDGANSHWQSDIRLANTGAQNLQYALKFTPADPSAGGVKTTTINVDAGATTALDDIVRNWYGIGVLGESANGVLEVRPLTPSNKTGSDDVSVNKVTVVSSRTYTTGENGTLGQFIPAIPFSSFIGKAAQQAAASVLSLQQIAQSAQYRTNVGIVEGSGQPANVLLSIFDVTGKKLKDVPITLKGGEQAQFGSFLASVGIPSLNDGRIEVKVTSGDGRVTAYASVVDNQSTDPLLVTGVKLGAASADKYVLPGVANIDTGIANWRTDMRIFNGGASAQNATLTFFRQGASPLTQSVVINAGEIRALDDIVASLFGVSNSGGAVHVTTSTASNLIVSGRTYNATANGTFGQFIPAVTVGDSIANGDRPLQILQAEDSVRYRTNLGITEVTGRPAGVDVSVVLPDSKVTPIVHLDLAANDFQQFDVFKSLGLDNTYNARITIRVTTGDGRVTAYGSVVDMLTNDPTYVPAQQ